MGRNRRPSASHLQTLSHNVVLSRHRHERGNFSGDKRVKWVNEKRKFIQGLLLKIGVSFTVYLFLLQKILNYRTFKYKLIHRILITNSFFHKCELKETELCTFCTKTKESIVHIFWECNYVRNFWLAIGNFLKICGVGLPFNAKDIIFGLTEHNSTQGTLNNLLIILKYYICLQMQIQGP